MTQTPRIPRRTLLAAAGAGAVLTGLGAAPSARAATRLTNLSHLDELTTTVRLRHTAAHSTYRLPQEPAVGLLWVYADVRADGGYRPVGGGSYDAASDTWGQGAYDSDDIARAAVVYLREWRATGSSHARRQAYQQLRGLAYFQTLTGEHAGEFLLWMQPDGTLNPTPTPPDNPNPADAGESYWTARALWAFGEGYVAFARHDPAFAAFLRRRMELAIAAVERDTLVRYGTYHDLHGVRVPAWLITQGADATSEALLGLAPYAAATGSAPARRACRRLARGVAEFAAGSTTQWPFRALLPWAESLDDWHAWGSEMAQGLAAAAKALRDPGLLRPAIGDTAGFTAQLLTATGPDNGWLPVPLEKVQIAYGADARVRACYEVGRVAGREGITRLAGIAAGWFFGANRAGVPTYDPATGVTFDGVEADGRLNRNSGAESTIHGLLTMQVLDAAPALARLARASARIGVRDGLTVIEAEAGTLGGSARVESSDPAWTGESLWSGKRVVGGDGATTTWTLPASAGALLVQPVVALEHGSAASVRFTAGDRRLGRVRFGDVGPQGDAASPLRLTPVALDGLASAGTTVTATVQGAGSARLDALLVMPEIARLEASGSTGAVVLLTSKSERRQLRTVSLPGGRLQVESYDRNGMRTRQATRGGRVVVEPGGFTLVFVGTGS